MTLPAAATAVIKAQGAQRYTLGLAYPADQLDGHGEFMSAADLEATAWAYVEKGREVGLYHLDGTVGRGTVVESYIYRGPDWQLDLPAGMSAVVKAGDWLMGVRWDDVAWALIEAGQIDGLSIQGQAIRRPAPDAVVAPAA